MKNMKKVVAALSATAVMAMGVSAFAAATNATYENGAASITLSDLADQQLTVIIIDADKADDTLAAEDLYYINQGEDGETFWTNMGTKVDLADLVEDGESKDFIIRIGGEDLSQVIEATFTISKAGGETEYIIYGDANKDRKVSFADAIECINCEAGADDCVFWDYDDDDWTWTYCDFDGDEAPGFYEAVQIIYFESGNDSDLDDLLTDEMYDMMVD